LPGNAPKIPGGPPASANEPYAAIEICEPRPANWDRASAKFAAVTDSPRPAVRSGPVPVGCRTFDGSPCSSTGASAAAATSTTLRA
jgi:hypothetical protein